MAAPLVYRAINAIMSEFAAAGVAKTRTNVVDDYQYRSIDDLLNALSPILARHRLCVLPRVIERVETEKRGADAGLLVSVSVRVAFSLVSVKDASTHEVEAFGEALDESDKATAKAMSAAYKCAMIQTFCIPVKGSEDADATHRKLVSKSHVPEPVQGWDQWWRDIADIVDVCESEQAIDTVQQRNWELLKAVSRERPELYELLGKSFAGRRQEFRARDAKQARSPASRRKTSKVNARLEAAGV
jgi:hypothetical protein